MSFALKTRTYFRISV